MLINVPASASDAQASMEALSASLNTLVDDVYLTGFFKSYAKYIIEHGLVESKKECTDHLGAIISAAMDRGDCTKATMTTVLDYIKTLSMKPDAAQVSELFDREIMTSVNEAIIALDTEIVPISEEERAAIDEYQAAIEALNNAMPAFEKLIVAAGKVRISNVVSTYKKLLKPEFIATYR